METFVIKLIIAVVPLVALVVVVILADICHRKGVMVKRRAKQTRAAVRHAFAVAATQKWF